MAEPLDRLFHLLPAYYRSLDAAPGAPPDVPPGPLQALLRLIAGQAAAVEADIARLYDDQFIETCQPWVAPYLGDLVGYQAVEDGGAGAAALSPRADVANTIAVRRRKGTLAVVEQLARDVAGWPAVAVELADRVGHFVAVRFAAAPRPWRPRHSAPGGFLDVRDPALARALGTPFDPAARTADVRRVSAARHPGRASAGGVAVFAYRLRSVPGPSPAWQVLPRGFTFDPLGRDVPLFTRPDPLPDRDPPPAGPLGVPAPIRRGMLPGPRAAADGPDPADYYGTGRSFALFFPDPKDALFPAVKKEFGGWKVFPAAQIFGAKLDDWETKADAFPPAGRIAVDPERGRLMLAADLAGALAQGRLYVSYHYGTPDTLGAGGHPWAPLATDAPKAPPVADGPALMGTVAGWHPAQAPPPQQGQAAGVSWDRSPTLLIELGSRDVFAIPDGDWTVPAGCTLHVRAGRVLADDGARTACPVLRPDGKGKGRLTVHLHPGHPADKAGGPVPGARLVLEGLLLADLELVLTGPATPAPAEYLPADVLLHQVTLVPAPAPAAMSPVPAGGAAPPPPAPPSPRPYLRVEAVPLRLRAERCVLGAVSVARGGLPGAPAALELDDTILDAGAPDAFALADPGGCVAPAVVTVRRCTVNGRVEVHALELAENSLFLGPVHVARRQRGCVRYCYVNPQGRRTPRRHQCQPDLFGDACPGRPVALVRPAFTSTHYGAPGYFQLVASAPRAIAAGADDEGEMGAYHGLQQGRRAARLRARLAEFTPADFDVALIFVT